MKLNLVIMVYVLIFIGKRKIKLLKKRNILDVLEYNLLILYILCVFFFLNYYLKCIF